MQNQRVCPNCGTPAQPGEQFCGECGAPLPAATTQNVYQTGGPVAPPPGIQSQPYAPPPIAPKSSSNSMPLIIGGAVALVAIIAVVAFLALNNKGGGGGGGGTGGGGNSTNLSNADLLKKAAANMRAATSYHIEANGKASGSDITMGGDLDVPNKKSKLNMVVSGLTIDVITIGSDAYLSTDGGKNWQKSPTAQQMVNGLGEFTGMWSSFNSADIDSSKDQLKDGTPASETIDGVECRHIVAASGGLSSLGGSGSNVELWVTTAADPTVRQVKVSGSSSVEDFTIKWSNINGDVNISAPPTSN